MQKRIRWPALTERPWALHGKRKRHFSEFSSGAARGAANAGSSGNTNTRRTGRSRTGNAGNWLPQTLSVFFFFWGRGVETRCSCCRPPTLCAGAASRNRRQRSGDAQRADEGSTQREACNGGQQTARQAHRSKGPEKALRSAVCERCGDRWSRPRYRHRHTRANEQQRAALCGPVRRTRLGSAARWRLRCRTAFQGCFHQRRAHWGWWRGAVDYS